MNAADIAHTMTALLRFEPKDQFDAPPDSSSLIGRPFQIRVPVEPPVEGGEGFPTWRYEPSSHTLTLSSNPTSKTLPWSGATPSASIRGIYFLTVRDEPSMDIRRTNLGLRKRVRVTSWSGLMVGRFGHREPDSLEFTTELDLAPDVARGLAPNLELLIEGEVLPINAHSVVACADEVTAATLSDPNEDERLTCAINARITHMSFVDRRNHQVLAQHSTEPSSDSTTSIPNRLITNPEWLRRPTAEDMDRYYPPRANTLEKEGRATMSCTVTAEGTMSGCSILSEVPEGFGFGNAALQMAKIFRMRVPAEATQPIGGATVSISLSWRLPQQ